MTFVNFRRVKVLIFVILLFALNSVYSADSLNVPGLLHLVKGSGNGAEGLCVAFGEETYSAIEWSYPIPEYESELPETVSSYLPSLSSSYGCNFEEDQECNKPWTLKSWTVPALSTRNYVPILDSRWEDLRTYLITNKTKISENRIEIPKNSNIGISIRSGGSVDILLCGGYNPESYPCYTITLGGSTKKETYIRKYGVDENLTEYKGDFPVLSVDEWKNFNLYLSKTGQILLREINKNISYLNITDGTPLNALYLLMNSSAPSLWKIHKNHFLFTNTSQYVPFGPAINATGNTICLSMYLMMCENCSIYFYKMVNNDKEIVFQLQAAKENNISYEWKSIKLIINNVTEDSVQLFVKTNSNATDQFWAIDDIRICTQDEFKMRRLSKGNSSGSIDFQNSQFSCHSLKFPEWRPKQQVVPRSDLPILTDTTNTTSIQLSWTSFHPQPFIIKYKGYDICDVNTPLQFKNIQRLKSNGWLVVKPKEKAIIIDSLVPYTHYSLSFIDPIYGMNKTLFVNTNSTEKLTKDELPLINIVPKTNKAVIIIFPRKCNISYGPIVYGLDIMQQSSPRVLFDVNVSSWENLEPYSNYTLVVQVARFIKHLNNTDMRIVNYYNFTTKPDVAPMLDFVDMYEVSGTSVSVRYKLPVKLRGQPILIQVRSCNPLMRDCLPKIFNITECPLWKHLYCVTIEKLMRKISYTFNISIKNNNTNSFGEELKITAMTSDRVPGIPTNLSYDVVNCSKETEFCNLNVSWTHPYYPNGSIKAFEIFLLGGESPIVEIVLIENGQYLPVYWHLIRYIPYAKTYNMSIRACNYYHQGPFATTIVKIDHIAQHIDQTPKIVKADENGVTFQIPKLDYRLNSSTVITIVQNNDSPYANISQNLMSMAVDSLCLQNKTTWIAGIWEVSPDSVVNITIGNNTKAFSTLINDTIVNTPLLPKTDYCITFVVKNMYKDTEHIRVYYKNHVILEQSHPRRSSFALSSGLSTGSIVVLVLLVLLIIMITVIGVLVYRQRAGRRYRRRSDGEHIYEAMPNDDHDYSYNVVYNAIYDKLNHD